MCVVVVVVVVVLAWFEGGKRRGLDRTISKLKMVCTGTVLVALYFECSVAAGRFVKDQYLACIT